MNHVANIKNEFWKITLQKILVFKKTNSYNVMRKLLQIYINKKLADIKKNCYYIPIINKTVICKKHYKSS